MPPLDLHIDQLLAAINRLTNSLERTLDRGFVAEHDAMRVEMIQLRSELSHLKRDFEKLEEDQEQSGLVYQTELQNKLKERDTSAAYWVRYVVAALVTLTFMGISVLLGYLVRGH